MSVKIRLARTGKKNQPSYRIVATDTHSKRDGKFLEILGFYNEQSVEKLRYDKEKIGEWLKKGAQITPAVTRLLETGVLKKTKVSPKKAESNQVSQKNLKTQAETQPDIPTESPDSAKEIASQNQKEIS